MKKLLIHYWGMDADETGLTRKINWKWLIQDVVEFSVCLVGAMAGMAAIIICIINK